MVIKEPEFTSPMKPSKKGGRFIFYSLVSIFFLCILASVNEIRLETVTNNITRFISVDGSSISSEVSRNDKIRILIGILTIPSNFQRRDLLRRVYALQHPVQGANIDVKFVFCNITNPDEAFLVSLETKAYNDIMILNCTENMDNGKTFTYFSSLPKILPKENNPPYHYVMKTDDDTYLRLGNLAKSLTSLPRHDLYYGNLIPCMNKDPCKSFMSGMGYLVSWDIVEWLEQHLKTIPREQLVGPEDRRFENILRTGSRGKSRFTDEPGMYDFPEPPTKYTHALWPGTVGVHLLKTQQKWIKTLKYFNVTLSLHT